MSVLHFSKNDHCLGMTMRRAGDGPESKLVDLFISNFEQKNEKSHRDYAVFCEPLLPTGFPDIVIAEFKKDSYDQWKEFRGHLEVVDFKLLHHLYCVHGANSELISRQLGFSKGEILNSIERLIDANLVDRRCKKWVPIPLREAYGITSLQAIEAKVDKWSSVLNQAFINKWFASESYVLLPVIKPSKRNQDRASQQGIGIYTLADNRTKIKRFLNAPRGHLPTSYMSWLFNEWIGRKILSI